jgi:hypothetical protein
MYNVLRQGRLLQGKSMCMPTLPCHPQRMILMYFHAEKNMQIKATLETAKEPITTETTPGIASLRICAAGRAFPAEDVVRGRRRAGGLALCVPSWTIMIAQGVYQSMDGKAYAPLADGQTIIFGLCLHVLVVRCSLMPVIEALRATLSGWIDQEEAKDGYYHRNGLRITSDLLQNTTQVLEWGRLPQCFSATGPAPLHQM